MFDWFRLTFHVNSAKSSFSRYLEAICICASLWKSHKF